MNSNTAMLLSVKSGSVPASPTWSGVLPMSTMPLRTQERQLSQYPSFLRKYLQRVHGAAEGHPGRKWEVCSPSTVGRFSAVGYFFGQDIYKALNIPVGLISVNWGGTRIEPWTSTYGFSTQPSLKGISNQLQANIGGTPENIELSNKAIADVEKWIVEAKKAIASKQRMPDLPDFPNGIRYLDQGQPTVLFNNMVAPLTRYPIRGMLWYQGEANIGEGALYTDK